MIANATAHRRWTRRPTVALVLAAAGLEVAVAAYALVHDGRRIAESLAPGSRGEAIFGLVALQGLAVAASCVAVLGAVNGRSQDVLAAACLLGLEASLLAVDLSPWFFVQAVVVLALFGAWLRMSPRSGG